MGNALSYLVLALAIPVGVALFFAFRPAKAALWVFLGCTMLLPEVVVIDFPGLPGIGKIEAASLACALGLVLTGRRKLRAARALRGPEFLVLLLLVGNVATVMTNPDALVYGSTTLPALDLNEAISVIFKDALWYLVPFVVGRVLISDATELRFLLTSVALAGALYVPLLFIELVMSPQLHRWIYGFHQHAFEQTLRAGGYRPMVFMTHGLAVALMMAFAALAALALARARRPLMGLPAPAVAGLNLLFLAACKSLGALLYILAVGPLTLLLSPRNLGRLAVLTGALVIAYPACRAADLVPTKTLLGAVRSLSPDRAGSLQFRFDMEDLITQHVKERATFGWGRFGRSMVYDPTTGRPVSVSDGHWIVMYGSHGVFGFACLFLLLVWPLWSLRKRLRRVEDPRDRVLLAGLASLVIVGTVDLIPNGMFNPLVVLFAGALYGAARALSASVVASSPAATPPEAR